MKILNNKTITDVRGIMSSGISSGIKKSGKKDLCVIYSKYKSTASAVFTKNKAKAAPLIVNMKNIKNENIQAIVVNSGNANACTGEKGLENAYKMAECTAKCLGILPTEVLVASTGVIGVQLPMDKILPGIESACSSVSEDGGMDSANAILTTDTFAKTITIEFEIEGKTVMMSGIAKGSGMIHPNMATMLSFIVTDANISGEMLDKAFKSSVEDTYNMVSVDGDTSTNDMAAVLANGASGHSLIDCENQNYVIFKDALHFVNTELAKMIAKDGEGAAKLVEVNVLNAKTKEDARLSAKSVISSSLVKCAIFGSDPNWGRIVCALGYSNADLNLDALDVTLKSEKSEIQIVKYGTGVEFDEKAASEILSGSYIKIIINLNGGSENATAWGCDLSYDYVKINGSYRT